MSTNISPDTNACPYTLVSNEHPCGNIYDCGGSMLFEDTNVGGWYAWRGSWEDHDDVPHYDGETWEQAEAAMKNAGPAAVVGMLYDNLPDDLEWGSYIPRVERFQLGELRITDIVDTQSNDAEGYTRVSINEDGTVSSGGDDAVMDPDDLANERTSSD